MKRARLILLAALLSSPAFGETAAPANGAGTAVADAMQEITVNPGDTMWSIANRYLKDPQRWPEIVKNNKLPTSDPTIALPGTKIKIPVMLIKEEYRNAQLIRLTPEVRYKRKEEADWKVAQPDMMLRYEDSLRTMNGAQARVLFPTREEVQINENSLVVLKPEKILQEVQIVQGDIRASRAKVIMPGGTVVKPHGMASDYQAKVRQDKSEVVFVYRGEVDVTAHGETVRVREGFGTQVLKEQPPSAPAALSSFPDFNPSELVMAVTEGGRPSLDGTRVSVSTETFSTASGSTGTAASRSKSMVSENIMVAYEIQLGKDAKFDPPVLEKKEKIGASFMINKQDIPDGTYAMRIAFIDAFGSRGNWSAPTTVVKDTVPPKIDNLTPADNQRFVGEESYCDIIGVATDAAVVTVNGELVFLSPTGRFSKYVTLHPGANPVSVVARDTAGNQTVINRTITYDPNGK
ncbi:MAG: LysM peptidoglycan-binding domain-containing protein [Elusimicrobia bacterium]|nr:LysM peptidoglycan-binding domain-containing protein [Elusimicrobiota bacterium]